ncbi:MAG: hypothetical protein K0R38_903 [Polyangiaceae bacterium]|jgi:hypothetical protein|nr:hypothetical protein [Polyangiaceae bacterium]
MGHSNAAFRVRRRIFLSALGVGLSAAAASRLSSVALAQATPASKRFLLFYMPHGAPPEHFSPQVMANDPTQFSLSAPGVGILGPFEEQLKAYTTVVQGIRYPKGAQTHEALAVALSGLSGPDEKLPDEGAPRVTLEHQIAAGLNVKPLVLGACAHRPFGLDKDGKLMWDGTPVVPEKNPLAAYDAVFSGISAPKPDTGPDPDVELTNSLRSLTEGELQTLSQELNGLTEEQTKLKKHLDAIASLKAGGGGGAISCDSAPSLPALEALRTAAAGQSDEFFLKEENFPMLLAAQLAVAGAAIKCNARQVVAVQPMYTNCEFDFKFMQSPGPHHSLLSHTTPQADAYPAKTLQVTARQAFAKCQRWFMEQLYTHALAGLLEPDPADPSKKVIDNTIVYVMSEIGDGAWHTTETKLITTSGAEGVNTYIPSVIIGGGGGALKPGRVVTFPQDRPAGDLYRSLCQAMGTTGTFPDSTGMMAEVLA